MPQIDIRLQSTADMSGFQKLGVGIDELHRKLERKFSLPDVGYDLLRSFGIGSGGAVIERALESFFGGFEAKAKAAEEEAKKLGDSIDKVIASAEKLAQTKVANWIESLAPSDKISAKKREIQLLTEQIAEQQKKYSAAYNAIAAASTTGGKLKAVITGSPEKGEYNIIGSQAAWAAHQAFIKKNMDAQVEAQEKLVELQTRLDELTNSLDKDKTKLSDSDHEHRVKALTESIAAQEAEFDRIVAAQKKSNDEWDKTKSSADAIRQQTSEQAKYRVEVERINALRGKPGGLTNTEADAAIAQAGVDRLKRTKDQADAIRAQASEEEKYRIEVEKINALRGKDGGLSDKEVAAAIAQLDAERKMVAERQKDRDLSTQLGALESARALIENDNLLTRQEKNARLLPLLEQQNKLISARLALLNAEASLSTTTDPKLRAQLQETIDRLQKELADAKGKALAITQPETLAVRDKNALRDMGVGANADGTQAQIDPTKHYTSIGEGAAGGAVSSLEQIGTAGDAAAQAVSTGLNATLSTTSDWLYNLASGAMTFHDAWRSAIASIGQQFLRMATDMVAKMIWRSTIERTLTALGVTLHVAGEGAKTAASTTGFFARLGLKIKEVMADVYHGAIAAFKAMAGIPYVGPILAVAAMAAALAGGVALVSKIGHAEGGFHDGPGWVSGPGTATSDSVNARLSDGEWVAPVWQTKHPVYGPMIAALEAGRKKGELPGFSGGGLFGFLQSSLIHGGVPEKLLLPQVNRFFEDYNLINGKKVYGSSEDSSATYDYNTASWIPDTNIASAITQPAYSSPSSAGSKSNSSGTSSEAKATRIVIIDARNTSALEDLEADPRFETKVVRLMRDNRGVLGVTL